MRVYIVTKTDYRYVNGRFFPVDTFDTNIRNALYHINILVGVYDSFSASEAAVDEDIRVNFNINEFIDNYKSSIRIEKYYYSNKKEINVLVPDSDGLTQIQMVYHINIKDFEVPVDDDKKGIQLKDLKSEDIDCIAEEAADKLSENEECTVVECFIDDDTIYFVDPSKRRTSVEASKDDDDEFYNDHLLYILADRTNIYTHFYDLRERKPGHNLVIELTGVHPYKDDSDPLKETSIKVYITDAVKERKCIYEKQYLVDIYDDENIFNDFSYFSKDNLNLSEYDNLYIVDERVHPTQKNPPKEAAEKLSESEKADEDNEYVADECYIDNDTIDFVGPGNRRTSAQVSKDYSDETYNEDLLYELADATDIYTHFYDLRERYPGKNLVLELTGVQPIKDNYDPDDTTWVKAYCTDAVKERKCVYEVKYPMMLSDISYNIIFNFLNFADDNLDLSEYDNLYIIDKRVHPVEKESSKEEEKKHNKAIECTISTSDYNNDNTLLVFKFKICDTCSTKSLTKIAINTKDFIRYLKQYTDSHTKFIDERVGLSWITFYSRISYDCHIIEMDADTITLKHYNHSNGTIDISFKNERKYFEFALDNIKDANIIYIHDETVHLAEKESSKEEDENREKAVKCTIYNCPHHEGGAWVNVIYKFKNDKKEKKAYTSSNIFINDLKKYTDKNTIFYDMRIGTDEYFDDLRFYQKIYIININGDKDISLIVHYNSNQEKIIKEYKSLEEAFNDINQNIYIRSTYKM